MKYIECGIGNSWFVRTETELEDGTEKEERGVKGPIKFKSVYLRIWIRKTVIVLDSAEGYKHIKKNRTEFKWILGIVSL